MNVAQDNTFDATWNVLQASIQSLLSACHHETPESVLENIEATESALGNLRLIATSVQRKNIESQTEIGTVAALEEVDNEGNLYRIILTRCGKPTKWLARDNGLHKAIPVGAKVEVKVNTGFGPYMYCIVRMVE